MAKLAVNYDTVSKQMTAAMDDNTLDSVLGISMYQYKDDNGDMKCRACITRAGQDSEHKLSWTHNTYAALKEGEVEVKESESPSLEKDVLEYFKS